MGDRLLDAFGYPRPSPALRRLVEGAVRAPARATHARLVRRRPRRRTRLRHRTYPRGYRIEELGPPFAPT